FFAELLALIPNSWQAPVIFFLFFIILVSTLKTKLYHKIVKKMMTFLTKKSILSFLCIFVKKSCEKIL
ncbi:MAG: hypothetical protein D3905_14565, partial [Candidatus Electrothrix sp. AS4_5]|nr:hypothetical protein [Candidatus Electrothrix gigas]